MFRSNENSKSENKRKSKKSPVKREQTLLPVVDDEPTGPDLINNLNNDCLGRVFQHLSFKDKLKIERVCKRWRSLSELAWKNVDTLTFIGCDKACDLYQLPPKSRNNRGVGKLLKKCGVHVKELRLHSPCDLRIMPIVRKYCQNLTILQVDLDRSYLSSNIVFPQLQGVKLSYQAIGNRSFPEAVLRALPTESLTEIDLVAYKAWLPRMAATVFKNSKQLSRLSLHSFKLESAVVAAISEKSTLISLTMSSCDLEGGFPRLTLLTNLKHLDLFGVDQVNDNFLKKLSHTCHSLEVLALCYCHITDAGIIPLCRLSKLEELTFRGVEGITDIPLGNLTNLRRLRCYWCKGIHDKGIIELLLKASNLQFLSLEYTPVTIEILKIANEITKKRTNNIPLQIWVGEGRKNEWNEKEVSPLLIVKR